MPRQRRARSWIVLLSVFGMALANGEVAAQSETRMDSDTKPAGVARMVTQGLARLAKRNMQLNCTIQDGQVWLADENESVEIHARSRTAITR